MDYSDLNKVNIFFSDVKKIAIGLLLGFFVMLFFRGCNHESSTTAVGLTKNEISIQKQLVNDYKHKFDILEIENAKLIQQKDSLKVVAELSKNNLLKLQHQRINPPKYIDKIADCNDTLQSVFRWGIQKDSACNVAIQNLDNVIFAQDSIKDIDDAQKKLLLKSILVKDNLLNNSEKENLNLVKETTDLTNSVKQESNKKNFWKTTAAAAGLEILRRIIFK